MKEEMNDSDQSKSKKKIIVTSVVALIVLLGGYFLVFNSSASSMNEDMLLSKLAEITSADFEKTFIVSENFTLEDKIFLLAREGEISLPNSFSYKNGISSLPENKEERDRLLSSLELGGLYLFLQGAEAIGVEDRVFYKYDLDALLKAKIIDEEALSNLDQDAKSSFWIEAPLNQEASLFIPEEMFYLKNIAEISKDVIKTDSNTFEGIINLKGFFQTTIDFNSFLTNNNSEQEFDLDGYLSNLSIEQKEIINIFNKSKISIKVNGERIDSIKLEIYTSMEPLIIEKIEFSKVNSHKEINVPNVEGPGSIESRDASQRDYERGAAVSYIKSAISSLYSGRNSFPISESEVNLDDFDNPTIKKLLVILVDLRKDYSGVEEAETFWKNQLKDPQPEKYHYSYQSFDDGDSFSITYVQENPNRAFLGDYVEQCDNQEGVCQIKEVLTGKHIRDDLRRFRINEIVSDLSVLMTAGSLKSFPVLTNAKFGTSETNEVEDLLKTSGLLPNFGDSDSIWQPKSFEDLIKDPDFPNNYYLYNSNGTVFSIKVKLENTPEDNNAENLLKDFCELSGTIFKRYCTQEGSDWYLIQDNARK